MDKDLLECIIKSYSKLLHEISLLREDIKALSQFQMQKDSKYLDYGTEKGKNINQNGNCNFKSECQNKLNKEEPISKKRKVRIKKIISPQVVNEQKDTTAKHENIYQKANSSKILVEPKEAVTKKRIRRSKINTNCNEEKFTITKISDVDALKSDLLHKPDINCVDQIEVKTLPVRAPRKIRNKVKPTEQKKAIEQTRIVDTISNLIGEHKIFDTIKDEILEQKPNKNRKKQRLQTQVNRKRQNRTTTKTKDTEVCIFDNKFNQVIKNDQLVFDMSNTNNKNARALNYSLIRNDLKYDENTKVKNTAIDIITDNKKKKIINKGRCSKNKQTQKVQVKDTFFDEGYRTPLTSNTETYDKLGDLFISLQNNNQ